MCCDLVDKTTVWHFAIQTTATVYDLDRALSQLSAAKKRSCWMPGCIEHPLRYRLNSIDRTGSCRLVRSRDHGLVFAAGGRG